MKAKRYRPRTALYVSCFLAALGYAQWGERLRDPTATTITEQAGAWLQFAHDEFGELVSLVIAGKRIEATA